MTTLNRREVVFGMGALAGLGATGSAAGLNLSLDVELDPVEVLKELHLTGAAESRFLDRLATGSAPRATLDRVNGRPARQAEGRPFVQRDLQGRSLRRGLAFVCDAARRNDLYVGRRPLTLRRLSYSTVAIAWTPGDGLPFYDSFAPRFDYVPQAYYPAAKWHQIVPLIGRETYFTGCQGSDVCESPTSGAVSFDVNDTDYDDNVGSYVVALWGWS